MNRWLLLIGLLLVSVASFATTSSFPALFTPAPDDLSIWYLGNIFGADLMTGLVDTTQISSVRLLSVLFGIFNQIALVVGIIIIVYTVMAGTLNTAHEGKPLGEKWNSVWMPVRISAGIALLVPKGGTGYCLAQSLVMWLTVQGIGSADQVWNAMIDYFAQGGAIYSNETAQANDYLNAANLYYTLNIQGDAVTTNAPPPAKQPAVSLLKSMVCIQLFNNDANSVSMNSGRKYEAYTLATDPDILYFGDQVQGTAAAQTGYTGDPSVGAECGAVQVTVPDCPIADAESPNSKCGTVTERQQIYTLANWNMAQGLQGLAQEITTNLSDDTNWESYYSTVFNNSQLYITYLVGYQDFLYYAGSEGLQPAAAFDIYKKYGWILAGNYYTVLSGFKERVAFLTRKMIPPASIYYVTYDISSEPTAPTGSPNQDAYNAITAFWGEFNDDTVNSSDPTNAIQEYMPTYGQMETAVKGNVNKHSIGIVNMDEIFKNLANRQGSIKKKKGGDTNAGATDNSKKHKRGSGSKKSQASSVTLKTVSEYINYLTGEGSGQGDLRVAKDPILRASDYGKSLTSAGIAMITIGAGLSALAAAAQVCTAANSWGFVAAAIAEPVFAGLLSLGLFMYGQGAMLGVFIPLIPYVTFFIGVVGWLMQVIEAVSAAPLVAIGLVFPETRDDIWGRAAPAMMLILGLFLRPPLMLVGFAAAMMTLWVLTELLNIGFLTLTAVTFRVEDMFGFVVIMTAYTGVFTVVVTRSYELINIVPDKVLNWISGPGNAVKDAGDAIGAAKGGVGEGAGAVSAGVQAGSKTAGTAAGKLYEKKRGPGGGASTGP